MDDYLLFGHLQKPGVNLGMDHIEETALFTGHAKLPSGSALYEFLKIISCALIIHLETGKVLNASFTTLSPMTGAYVSSLLIGWSVHEGMEVLEQKFDKHCYITSKKAFLKAIEIACQKYKESVKVIGEAAIE